MSPINITGPTAIAKGVTVTVEPGVVVDFNTYDTFVVNGTLRAIGTSGEPITFDGNYRGRLPVFGSSDYNGILGFGDASEDWNEQTGKGCIIENVNVISLSIWIGNVSVKVNNNVFSGPLAWSGLSVDGGDSIISKNKLMNTGIGVIDGAPVIRNNTLIGHEIHISGGSPTVFDNLLYSGNSGITVSGTSDAIINAVITDNIIAYGFGFAASTGNVTFEHNLVLHCYRGCLLD